MSDNGYTKHLAAIAAEDARFLAERDTSYGSSWKKRGGVGAYMMLCRKMDRLDQIMSKQYGWDVFRGIEYGAKGEDGTVLAEVRDLRRYLLLCEAEMVERGVVEPPPVPVQKQKVYDPAKIQGMVGGGGGTGSFSGTLKEITERELGIPPAVPTEDSNKHAPRLRRQQNHTELMTLPKEDQLRYRWVDGEQSYVLQPGKVIDRIFLPEKVFDDEYLSLLRQTTKAAELYTYNDFKRCFYLMGSDNE